MLHFVALLCGSGRYSLTSTITKSHPTYNNPDICISRSVSGHQQVIEYEEGEGATNRIVDEDDDVRDGAIEV